MSGSASRLIAMATLVTFLVTNSYGVSHMKQSFSGCTCADSAPNHEAEESRACESPPHANCEHRHGEHDQSQSDPKAVPFGEHFADSASPICPCHGNGLPCPCPGGCAFCSVAKVPCLLSVGLPVNMTPTRGDGLAEITPSYTSPFHGTLTRPPRS